MTREAILKHLAEEPQSTAQLKRRLSASIAKPACESMIAGLKDAGLIRLSFGRWRLTTRGREAIPKPPEPRNWGTYVPPPRNWRTGSDAAMKLPSLFAGRRVER
jgi:hypothetical protein